MRGAAYGVRGAGIGTLTSMRLFVAVELDDTVRRAAEKAAEELRTRIGRSLNAKWVSPSHMHVTVRFIGNVADDRLPSLRDTLRPPLAISPFIIALGDCGAFPSHGPPRVLWIGLKQGVPSLQALHDEFNRRLVPLGFEPETRPFNPHLTLARIKDAPRGSSAVVRNAVLSVHVPSAWWEVREAVLFESRLSPKGSTYFCQLRVPIVNG